MPLLSTRPALHATIFLLLTISASTSLQAQPTAHPITEPTITTCAGALLDSGGEGAVGYGNNEDFTTTICADEPGQAITLNWITFNLSLAGPAPHDQVTIHDGPDTSAPIIGTYSGSGSPGIVSASFGNTSGCLTVHFTSNSTGTGVFAASILCFVPCEPPTAVAVMSENAPAKICQDGTVQFNASASFAAADHTITDWSWDFADGSTDNTSGPIVTHAFAESGEYVVQLTITDDNDCQNTNLIDLAVWVSTTPTFDLGGDRTVCIGDTVDLLAQVTPTTWTDLPNSGLGDGLFLPDNVGETFSTPITFGLFEPGATLTSVDQLSSFCLSMEHSFIGDLVVQLVCPNGQSVITHQQNGGGTFLGVPVDDDYQPDVQGECWNYCWTPNATNGTWAAEGTGGTLPPGDYSSLFPMSALVGCPLNGTWTLNITDLWASDNGFVCDWGLTFDPSLYPDLTTYTPVIGMTTLDSAYWNGPGLEQDQAQPPHASVVALAGTNEYVYTVMDDFGCTYSDTITITATGVQAVIDVVPPSPQPVHVSAQFSDASISSGSPITGWYWTFGPGMPTSQEADPLVVFDEPGSYPVTLTVTSSNGCTSTATLIYDVRPSEVTVPNVFSPNNDGSNDALVFTNAQFYPNNHLQVFSRWGNKVFESMNYRNTWRPADLSAGTYFYIFRMEDGREWTGHVTLLR